MHDTLNFQCLCFSVLYLYTASLAKVKQKKWSWKAILPATIIPEKLGYNKRNDASFSLQILANMSPSGRACALLKRSITVSAQNQTLIWKKWKTNIWNQLKLQKRKNWWQKSRRFQKKLAKEKTEKKKNQNYT